MPRSTRNKLKWQAGKAKDSLNDSLDHLIYLQELADDQSDYIQEYLCQLVVGYDALLKLLASFIQGL